MFGEDWDDAINPKPFATSGMKVQYKDIHGQYERWRNVDVLEHQSRVESVYNRLMQGVKNKYYRYNYFESFVLRSGYWTTKIYFEDGDIKMKRMPYHWGDWQPKYYNVI